MGKLTTENGQEFREEPGSLSYEELLTAYRRQEALLKEQDKRLKEFESRTDNGNIKYKSRLFSFIFGREEHKEWTLQLYNAISGSSHTDPNDIKINTIEGTVYMGMKNDLSFLVTDTVTMYSSVQIYEHQSTYNPNMPAREFMYAGMLYDKYIYTEGLRRYGSKLMPLPIPKLVVFYNGEMETEDQVIVNLSDAFKEEIRRRIENIKDKEWPESEVERLYRKADPDISVRVRMININYGRNRELLENCKPLKEYSWFVEKVRDNNRPDKEGNRLGIEKAINKAIDEMPDDFEIKQYLVANKAEVVHMCLTEYDEKKTMEQFKEEGREEGREEERVNTEAERKRADQAARRADQAARRAEEAEAQRDQALKEVSELRAQINRMKAAAGAS